MHIFYIKFILRAGVMSNGLVSPAFRGPFPSDGDKARDERKMDFILCKPTRKWETSDREASECAFRVIFLPVLKKRYLLIPSFFYLRLPSAFELPFCLYFPGQQWQAKRFARVFVVPFTGIFFLSFFFKKKKTALLCYTCLYERTAKVQKSMARAWIFWGWLGAFLFRSKMVGNKGDGLVRWMWIQDDGPKQSDREG